MLSHVHDAVLWSQGLSPHREQKCIVGDSCLTVELLKLKFQDTGFISCFHGFSILICQWLMSVVMVTHLMSVILGRLHFSDLIPSLSPSVRLTSSSVSPRRRLNDVAPTTDGTSLTSAKMSHSGKNTSLRLGG